MKTYNQSELLKQHPWDVLIVLDACRSDYFLTSLFDTNIYGGFFEANSNCKNTEEWYYDKWSRNNNDKILISANPHSKLTDCHKNFHKAIEIWEEDNWIYPEPALDVLIDLQEEYDKRFVVHLIPPHLPFIGKEGKEFMKTLGAFKENYHIYRELELWGQEYGWEKLIDYYCESIVEALNRIEKYLPKIKGTVIITSDHGEMIGESNRYGHNRRAKEVQLVPWFVVVK